MVLAVFVLVPESRISAHLMGQPPFFKINGTYTTIYYSNIYPVPQSSQPDIIVPQDNAPENYTVGTELSFLLETAQLGVPADVVAKTTFRWEMGDGTKLGGLTNTHTYTKPGSYFLTIYADYKDSPQPILIQSTLINIVPDPSYKVPKAVITVNGQKSPDPVNETLKFNYNKPLRFDASQSTQDIESVVWDFGDTTSSHDVKVSHQYDATLGGTVYPILQVKFKSGYISHAFIQIDRDDNAKEDDYSPLAGELLKRYWWIGIVGLAGIVVLVGVLRGKKKNIPTR